MEIEGKLIKKLPPVTGDGKNGPWKKQNFVIETQADYPKMICFTTWGDRVDFNSFTESDIVKVYFDIESREYNNNWYTDLKCWKVEVNQAGGSDSPSGDIPPITENDIPFEVDDDPGDDLPF
ncbi:MAG: hypothetical protein C0596_11510 [Marinilabiliales bacterium]|nr:MAG: hypothetical protein C0596_11510 [Marinilabiliales bacterium]